MSGQPLSARGVPGGDADSAGVPWQGRELGAHPFAGDPGGSDPALVAALAAFRTGAVGAEAAVVAALAGARVMVPVVAAPAELGSGAGGLPTDVIAELATVRLAAADGRPALPVFSGLEALAAWDPQARPVPVEAARAALAGVSDGCEVLLLDVAGPVPFLVRRPAVWALGQGREWVPAPHDPLVHAAVEAACALGPPVRSVRCAAGERAELQVVLGLEPGLDRAALDAVLARVAERLGADAVVAERVDSLELRVVPG